MPPIFASLQLKVIVTGIRLAFNIVLSLKRFCTTVDNRKTEIEPNDIEG